MQMMITKKKKESRWETLNSWNSDLKLKNLVYYVKLLNIFIIMENKDEWKMHFFFQRKNTEAFIIDRWV